MTKELNSPLIKLLREIIIRDDFFDAEVAGLILKKIGTYLKDFKEENIYNSENFTFSGNLWAKLCHNIDPNLSLQEITNQEKIEKWLSLFKVYCPEIIEVPQFRATFNYKNKFNRLDQINNTIVSGHFVELIKKGPEARIELNRLTPDEQFLFILDTLNPEQSYNIYTYLSKNHQENFFHQLFELLVDNKDKIFNELKIDGDVLMSYCMNSKVLKHLMSFINPHSLNKIIDEETLSKIYKKASLNENMLGSRGMLNNILPIMPPDKWIEIISNAQKEINICQIFEKRFLFATGYSLKNKKNNPEKREHKSFKQEFLKEMEYLIPGLDNDKISDENKITWYKKIILANFEELFLLSAYKIEIPTVVDSKLQPELDHLKILMKNSCHGKDYLSCYNDMRKIVFAQKMQKDLNDKTDSKKIKI